MEASSDLIPQSDLPGVPARHPRGEQPLQVAQEHHPVHTVVLTTGLLVETKAEPGYISVFVQGNNTSVVLHCCKYIGDVFQDEWNILQTTMKIIKNPSVFE